MSRYAFLLTLILGVTCACSVQAQESVSARTQDLIAQLDKTKYKKKDKGVVHIEIYVDVKHTPTPEGDIRDFSGKYVADQALLEIDVSADGSVTGRGYDLVGMEQKREEYTLKGARVDGSLLTGTRVFDDGRSEPFEALFAIETVRSGSTPNDARVTHTSPGIGYIQKGDSWNSRVFLEKLK